MPAFKRYSTNYDGVYFIKGTNAKGKGEKIFYIRYRKGGKAIDEKAGREGRDDMTPARAALLRAKKIEGEALSNVEKREQAEKEKEEKAGRWTLTRLWVKYLESKPDLKGKKQDKFRFQKYIKPTFGNKEPRELAPLDVDRLRLRDLKGLSPQSVKLTLALLKRLARFGVRMHLCEPIAFEIEMPKVNNLVTEDLTPEQLSALLKAIDEDAHEQGGPMMLLALFSGMRRGEILKLRWADVDFEKGFVHILDPKGGPDQTIPLNDQSRTLLTSLKSESEFVFPGRGGDRRKDLHKITRAIADKAGLPKNFRPLHGLRHYFASSLASSGKVDMYVLQKLLTHKDARTTQRYAHLRDEALKSASNLMGDLVKEIADSKKEKAQSEA
jgi:integrase